MKTKIAIAGLGWWGKIMVSRLSNSTKVDIVNLIDPVPDEEAVLLSQSKNLKLLNDYNQAIENEDIDAVILCSLTTLLLSNTITPDDK